MKQSPNENKNKTSKHKTSCFVLFRGLLVLVIYLFYFVSKKTHRPFPTPSYFIKISIFICILKKQKTANPKYYHVTQLKINQCQLFARHCFKGFTYIDSHTCKDGQYYSCTISPPVGVELRQREGLSKLSKGLSVVAGLEFTFRRADSKVCCLYYRAPPIPNHTAVQNHYWKIKENHSALVVGRVKGHFICPVNFKTINFTALFKNPIM